MNFKTTFLFMLLSLSDLSHALYGARAAQLNADLNAVVSLHLNDPQNPEFDYFCSGVLIASDKILTTGHCIEGMGKAVYERGTIFTFAPELLKVKVAGVKYAVSEVKLAATYFEAAGFEGEDLAVIRLKKSVTTKPLKLARLLSLKAKQPVVLVAQGKMAMTTVLKIKTYASSSVIFTDGAHSGICEGDSGGALLVLDSGEYKLAGILSAQSEGCEKTTGVSVFPRNF